MIRPRKMKHVELTVLSRDVDAVIEYLGRRGVLHFTEEDAERGSLESNRPAHSLDDASWQHIKETLEKLQSASAALGIPLPMEPDEDSVLPGEEEEVFTDRISYAVQSISARENEQIQEKKKVEETLTEAKAFANLNAPFSDLDQLSYLTLRVGRLDPRSQDEIREALADRAVIIPLDSGKDGEGGDRVLAAASRKGRFALDSELKRFSFIPISIPEGYQGVPGELLSGLESRLRDVDRELERIKEEKEEMRKEFGPSLRKLAASYLMASIVEQLKSKLIATKSIYLLSGWIPQDTIIKIVEELQKLTGGRLSVRTFNPDEVATVKEGRQKVPVSLEHGAFVKGFEGVVFSYGAPLYGTIDPTPFVAFFFTILFGIMFGDLGQGFVLLFLGILAGKRGIKALSRFRGYSGPLMAVGIASMVMGLLNGEVFTNEELLVGPIRAVTGLLFGKPVDRILTIMPLAEKGGSVAKLFYFFGFTISVGIILNSVGLLVNIVNLCIMKKYEGAFFSKTGVAGLFFFWYAVSIAVRIFLKSPFMWFDLIGLLLPVFCIFFGPVIWRLATGKRPVLEHGIMVFIVEGFVEILETASTYISNTVSFLRVGAFALSHAVLSYIVFRFSEEISHLEAGPIGPLAAFLIMAFGNAVIIVLEGMIVAIQVVRLQYYEFFSKFFIETGVEYKPFRFRKGIN
ncbi:MAG: V-type ATP synthase subunit I [Treponema sp.]|nr:V-type ATP synthase subunit I [Treponema sp.]